MRRRTAVLICSLIIIANVLGLVLINRFPSYNLRAAENGVLSLADWDTSKKGLLTAGGTWEFYPGELITPNKEEDTFKQYNHLKRFVKVPDDWRDYEEYASNPFHLGTFRLVAELPADGSFGITSNSIQYSAAVYLNGTRVYDSGLTLKELEYLVPSRQSITGITNSEARQMEIVIQVADYPGAMGGILHTVKLGTAHELLRDRDLGRAVDFFVISSCIVLGLCLIILYCWRKGSKNSFYFGMFLLMQGIYISTIGEKVITDIISMPRVSMVFYSFQIQIMYLSFFFLLLLINYFFHKYAKREIIIFLSILILVIGSFLNWVPEDSVFNMNLSIYQHKIIIAAIIIMSFGYILYVMGKAFRRGVEAAEYMFIIITAFICYLVTMVLEFLFELEVGKIPTFMMLILVLTQILFMNYRTKLAFRKVEQLSNQLLVYDKMKDKFLVKTSKELQKPVNKIVSNTEMLLEGEKGVLNLHQQQKVVEINREGKHIFTILEELLEASGENQEIVINTEDIDYKVLIGIVEDYEYLVHEKNLKLIHTIPIDLPNLRADKTKLRQIFYHLLQNAVKFTEEGEITVTAVIHGNTAFLSVKDTGTGIEKDQKDIIFIPFYQGKKEGNENLNGLGLGLSIAKNLVEMQGGKIWVISEPGKGACFTFSLPLGEADHIVKDSKSSMESIDGKEQALPPDHKNACEQNIRGSFKGLKEEIILAAVRDQESLRELKRLNQVSKYTLVFIDSHTKAMEYALNEKADLLILDQSITDVAALDVCKRIRHRHTMTELPIILLTEESPSKEMQKAVASGVNDFLKRPYSWEELEARIQTLLLVKKSAREAINQEMQNLHAQIMPHFLYNTLNTIIGLSFRDADKTCEALQHLSTYFRAKLDFNSYNSMISLERELELVKAYLSIEKMRYNERLEIVYAVDEAVNIMLPALTLQPLVENSVHHGIRNSSGKVTVEINIRREPGGLNVIEIRDNGPGISKEKLEELLADKNNRIGLSNVLRKIKLMKDADIAIKSAEESGTCITIYLK